MEYVGRCVVEEIISFCLKLLMTRISHFCFIFWCGIHTASVPSAAETHTGGGAVLGKPEGSPTRRHSRKIDLK